MLTIFLFCCNKTKKNDRSLIPNNLQIKHLKVCKKNIIDSSVSEYIKLDSIVVLESNENSLIGEVRQIMVTEDRIYVLDKSKAKSIFCFDKTGKFINKYKNIGKGSRQYMFLNSFDVVDNKVFITADYYRFLQLDKNLNFEQTINVKWPKGPFISQRIHMINKDTVLFVGYENDYNLYFYNKKKGEFIAKHLKVTPPFSGVDVSSYSYNEEKKFVVTKDFSDTIYYLTPERLIPHYIVDFEYPIGDETKQVLDTVYPFDREVQQEMYDIRRFFETEDYIYFSFTYQNRMHLFFYCKKTNKTKILRNDIENDVFGRKYFPYTKGTYGNSIIVPVDASDLLENKNKINVEVPENLNYNSNPVLVFFHPDF